VTPIRSLIAAPSGRASRAITAAFFDCRAGATDRLGAGATRLVRMTRALACFVILRRVDDSPEALCGGLPDALAVVTFRDAVMI
jgi:hypothetical protein